MHVTCPDGLGEDVGACVGRGSGLEVGRAELEAARAYRRQLRAIRRCAVARLKVPLHTASW